MQYRIEIPGGDSGAAVRDFVEQWLSHPALRLIVEAEGGAWPSGPAEHRAAELYDFSTRWDFRGGAERLDLAERTFQIPESDLAAAASELGLTANTRPAGSDFEHALVLGGTALASIYRVKHLYALRTSGVYVGAVGVLSALREIQEPERELVLGRPGIAALVQDAPTEFDVMVNATEHFAGGRAAVKRHPNAETHLSWAEATVEDAVVLAAPSGDASRRANTRDNYDVYSKRVSAGDRVLVVTSSIYLPYQFFIALQALGWDRPLSVEAVGFPPEWMDGVLTGPTNVLQELRSALFGVSRTLSLLQEAS